MVHTFSKRLLTLALLAALILLLVGCSKEKSDPLTLRVEEIADQQVILSAENETGNKVSFGWVSDCEILVTVDGRIRSFGPPSGDIPQGDSEVTLRLNGCEGEIQKIVITNLRLLNDRGLPDLEMKDVTIYDTARGIDSFSDGFEAKMELQDIMFIVVPVIMGVIFLIVIISIISTARKNKKVMAQFNPYGAQNMPGQPDMGLQMHMDAHRMHMDAHNQAVHQHNDFSMQASMPMDQGGFAPPPPPPPPGF